MPEYYSHVPRDLEKNLEYRLEVRKRASKDKGFRKAVMQACAEDVLYFFSTFCFLHEPRDLVLADGTKQAHIVPFRPWVHQEPVIRKLREALGQRDVGFDKSRGEGATWIMILLALHDWLFKSDVTIGVCSSTEEKTDIPEDRATILGKLDWEMTVLPTWMVGKQGEAWTRHKGAHKFQNLRNSNIIIGYGAVSGTGRSARYYWFFLDELGEWPQKEGDEVLASLQQATLSRAYVSTPMGPTGTYYDVMHRPSNMVRVTLDWKDNPTRNRGMYRLHRGKPVALDEEKNPLLPGYDPVTEETREMWARLRHNGFKLEGMDRSPWYDWECDRSGSPAFIARELDRNFEGSVAQWFTGDFFAAAEKTLMQPKFRGRLVYGEGQKPEFAAQEKGILRLWYPLDVRQRPPRRDYAIGVDVGLGNAGEYTSNSTAEVFDIGSMEQVADMAAHWRSPVDWAEDVLALCAFFYDAYLIWEMNFGPSFGKTILDRHYPNTYGQLRFDVKSKKRTKKVGWHMTDGTKKIAFDEFDAAVRNGALVLRDPELVNECAKYLQQDGKPVYARSKQDTAAAGKSHGDRVIGAALAYQAIKDRPGPSVPSDMPKEIPLTCPYNRFKLEEIDRVKKGDVWDHRSNWDLTR